MKRNYKNLKGNFTITKENSIYFPKCTECNSILYDFSAFEPDILPDYYKCDCGNSNFTK